ncbi:MAG: heat-inducible transcription repressor HrcA [Acidobacteria bacterium]|nr:heat-inducible transcription repressor HrcA [Acidobacteriota bacterium]
MPNKKTQEFVFDQRSRDILLSVIRLYIDTGEPVGSRTLSKHSKEKLSAATIRNIMADLEDAGYLTHPHTSAGRVPSDKGYRFYVDSILRQVKISKSDESVIKISLLDSEINSATRFMERTSHVLSQMSNNVGIVVSPSITQDFLQHIEFIKLTDGRILVIIVSRTGLVRDRVIRIEGDFSQHELDKTARYVTDNFKGLSMFAIRAEILRRMSEEKALYDRLLQNAILLCNQKITDEVQGEVYVDGTSTILSKPDFTDTDTERLRALFKMYEEKGKLLKIINECLAESANTGVGIRIGSENNTPSLRNCTIITSPYIYNGNVIGGVGVVGPTRMEYARMITVVNYIARLFEKVFSEDIQLASR